jgi:hypothetical protein
MTYVAIELSEEVASRLGEADDLARVALEALAAQGYRNGKLTHAEVQKMLGLAGRRTPSSSELEPSWITPRPTSNTVSQSRASSPESNGLLLYFPEQLPGPDQADKRSSFSTTRFSSLNLCMKSWRPGGP